MATVHAEKIIPPFSGGNFWLFTVTFFFLFFSFATFNLSILIVLVLLPLEKLLRQTTKRRKRWVCKQCRKRGWERKSTKDREQRAMDSTIGRPEIPKNESTWNGWKAKSQDLVKLAGYAGVRTRAGCRKNRTLRKRGNRLAINFMCQWRFGRIEKNDHAL